MHTSAQPYLVVIDEPAPLPNGLSIYPLKNGKTLIGTASEQNEILIYAQNQSLNCCLNRIEDRVYLNALNGYCQVNNRVLMTEVSVEDELSIELKHGDLILLGERNLFRFNNPNEILADFNNETINKSNSLSLSYLMRKLIEDKEKRDEIEELKERLVKYERMFEESRKEIQQMHEQIELSNEEMKKLKEASLKEAVSGGYLMPGCCSSSCGSSNMDVSGGGEGGGGGGGVGGSCGSVEIINDQCLTAINSTTNINTDTTTSAITTITAAASATSTSSSTRDHTQLVMQSLVEKFEVNHCFYH